MTNEPARWRQLEQLYHEALDRPADERASFVAQVDDEGMRMELAALLAQDEPEEDFFEEPALQVAARNLPPPEPISLDTGSLIGAYQILEQIGRGGMGMVYRAEQQYPVRREVALKMIKPGMDSEDVIKRFQAERQALAMMDHPNIARVLDAGTTNAGRLYFVMELVNGLPVTEYCQRHKLGIREKLTLFVAICQAIQHAHQKGIVHRDIKPSNILITVYDGRPAPKVIDFGIAKAMQEQLTENSVYTQVGAVVGTFAYMSPEQAGSFGADIDTRSDVYSLGAVLYELITGSTPLDRASLGPGSEMEMLRQIREKDPVAPSVRLGRSKLSRTVRHDLDWVVMKALEKDRGRRYASVSALGDDIENYLAGAAVAAGPPSTVYRLKRLAARYRGAIATVAAIVALLMGATAFSAREAFLARRAEQSAAAVNDFLENDLLAQASAAVQASAGGRPDPDLKVRTALDRAATQIDARFRGQPTVEASIRHTIGATYLDLGLLPQAQHHLERAVDLRRQTLGESASATLTSQNLLVNVYLGEGAPKKAEPLGKLVWATRRRLLGERHPATLASLHNLAAIERAFARDTKAEALYAEVAELRRQVLGPEHPDTLKSLTNLGFVSMLLEKFPQAVDIHGRVLAIRRRVLGDEHPETMQSRNSLGQALINAGQADQAEEILRQVLEWRRRVLGPSHVETLNSLHGLALVNEVQGKYRQAESLYAECIAIGGKTLGERHPTTAACSNNLAETLQYDGQYERAIRMFRKDLEMELQLAGPENPDALRSMSNLGVVLALGGYHAEARVWLEKAIALRKRILGPKHPKTLSSMDALAAVYRLQGQVDAAHQAYEEVAALRREVLGPKHPRTLSSLTSLSQVLLQLRRYRDAEPILREALAATGSDAWSRALRQSLLGACLAGQRRVSEAEPLLRTGYQVLAQKQASQSFAQRQEVELARRRLIALPLPSGPM